MTAAPVDAHPPPGATTDATDDDGRAASYACGADSAGDSGATLATCGVNAGSTYASSCGPSDSSRVGFHDFQSPPCKNSDTLFRDSAHFVTPGGNPTFCAQADGMDYQSRPNWLLPPFLDMTNATKGGLIISPRASNCKRLARELRTSRFDMATLAHSDYHGGTDGKPNLTIGFIHECGYDSISVEASKDTLLCYNDIILVHWKVVTG